MDKTAFITHTTDMGGASASLLTVLRALTGKMLYSDHILIYPKTNKSDAYIQLKHDMTSFQWRLPFSWIFRGAEPGIHRKAYRMLMEGYAMFAFLFKYNKILVKENVQTIYLNSLVLWCLLPVLPQHLNFVIHIRETVDESLEGKLAIWVIRNFADTIIAIDANVAKPFADLKWKVKIVPNPIDMTRAREERDRKNVLKTRADIPTENVVVALLAPIGRQKGHDFLLECLDLVKNENITFALAGIPDIENNNKLTNALKEYSNVKYFGAVWDVTNIYAMSDVVIRCEDYLPLGRTVWEGMYAGLPVLLPVRQQDDKSVIIDYLGRYMFTYEARNAVSFVSNLKFIIANKKKCASFPVASNVEESAKKFISAMGESPSTLPTLQYARTDKTAQ
jgi:glycosyltransferase involved in cell wall biosynthesis